MLLVGPERSTEGKGDTSKQAATGTGGKGSDWAPEIDQSRGWGEGESPERQPRRAASTLNYVIK